MDVDFPLSVGCYAWSAGFVAVGVVSRTPATADDRENLNSSNFRCCDPAPHQALGLT